MLIDGLTISKHLANICSNHKLLPMSWRLLRWPPVPRSPTFLGLSTFPSSATDSFVSGAAHCNFPATDSVPWISEASCSLYSPWSVSSPQ